MIETPSDYSLDQTDAVVRGVESRIMSFVGNDIQDFSTTVGTSKTPSHNGRGRRPDPTGRSVPARGDGRRLHLGGEPAALVTRTGQGRRRAVPDARIYIRQSPYPVDN